MRKMNEPLTYMNKVESDTELRDMTFNSVTYGESGNMTFDARLKFCHNKLLNSS